MRGKVDDGVLCGKVRSYVRCHGARDRVPRISPTPVGVQAVGFRAGSLGGIAYLVAGLSDTMYILISLES